jgi:hypothetical protein
MSAFVDKWFIKYDKNRKVEYAGKIGTFLSDTMVCVYLVNWIDGDLDFFVWNIERFDGCQIFEDQSEWNRIIEARSPFSE